MKFFILKIIILFFLCNTANSKNLDWDWQVSPENGWIRVIIHNNLETTISNLRILLFDDQGNLGLNLRVPFTAPMRKTASKTIGGIRFDLNKYKKALLYWRFHRGKPSFLPIDKNALLKKGSYGTDINYYDPVYFSMFKTRYKVKTYNKKLEQINLRKEPIATKFNLKNSISNSCSGLVKDMKIEIDFSSRYRQELFEKCMLGKGWVSDQMNELIYR